MTFWQDARPATPRFRRPRRWSRRKRRIALVLVAVVVVSAAISVARTGNEDTAKAATPAASRRRVVDEAGSARAALVDGRCPTGGRR